MPSYSKQKEQEFTEMIRILRVRNPGISLREIQSGLEQNGFHLHVDYINKLVHKLDQEKIHRVDQQTLNKEIADFEDLVKVLANELWKIILGKDSTKREKTSAIKTLLDSRSDLFDKKFDAGIFERQLGKIKAEGVLTPEQKEMINKALDYVHALGQNKGADS